ncbi:MAG: hypothetical protein IKE20_03560 [Eggerthellaceae bacterium]|nr:hypothetical protein [Eggerthellaceae bacterium]
MSKLTIDECKQIISKGRKQLTAAEGRIAELESTVLMMYREHPIAQFEQWIEDLGLDEADAWKAVKR